MRAMRAALTRSATLVTHVAQVVSLRTLVDMGWPVLVGDSLAARWVVAVV